MNARPYPTLAVVGHDGREGGMVALEAGLMLRERFGTELVVVHGLGLPAPRDIAGRPDEIELMRTGACDRVEAELVAMLEKRLGDAASSVELAVFAGPAAKAIATVASERRAELVIIGPHRKDGPLDFGRTSRAVLAATECDVWMQPGDVAPIDRVVVPYDGSDESARALDLGLSIAAKLGVDVCALQAYLPPDFAYPSPDGSEVMMPKYVIEQQRDAMRARFEESLKGVHRAGASLRSKFVDGDPAGAIEDEQTPRDLVVMGTHGHTGIAAALLGGVAAAVLKRAKGPVLAVRAKERAWPTPAPIR